MIPTTSVNTSAEMNLFIQTKMLSNRVKSLANKNSETKLVFFLFSTNFGDIFQMIQFIVIFDNFSQFSKESAEKWIPSVMQLNLISEMYFSSDFLF